MRRRSRGWKQIRLNVTDQLHSRLVRERDGWTCRWPGCSRSKATGWQVHAAHVFRRALRSTRWVPENAITLCAVHHKYAEAHQTEWRQIAHDLLGEATFRLLEIAANGPARRPPDELMARTMLREEMARLAGRDDGALTVARLARQGGEGS